MSTNQTKSITSIDNIREGHTRWYCCLLLLKLVKLVQVYPNIIFWFKILLWPVCPSISVLDHHVPSHCLNGQCNNFPVNDTVAEWQHYRATCHHVIVAQEDCNQVQDCLLQGQAPLDQRVVFHCCTQRLRSKKGAPHCRKNSFLVFFLGGRDGHLTKMKSMV